VVVPSAGSVVLVPFPFSDLSQSKLRPAVVLADAEHGDWILCQLTSSFYSDARAVKLENADFKRGSLRVVSYARPGKLFTANQELLVSQVGVLNNRAFERVRNAVLAVFRPAAK
jgi:mRNA interferase MazF